MKASLVPIGNSKGVRIPKVMLKESKIEDKVEIEREGEKIIIRPLRQNPREGWDNAFRVMHERDDDRILLDEGVEGLEKFEW